MGQERERYYYSQEIILLFWSFSFGVDSIFEEVAGFSPFWFPQENIFFHCILCFIAVHVIISNKILRS